MLREFAYKTLESIRIIFYEYFPKKKNPQEFSFKNIIPSDKIP